MLCPFQGDNQLYIVLATATYNKRTHKMYYEWYIVLDIYISQYYTKLVEKISVEKEYSLTDAVLFGFS